MSRREQNVVRGSSGLWRWLPVGGCLAVACIFCSSQQPVAADAPAAGSPQSQSETSANAKRVLRHAVFFKFKDAASTEDVNQIVEAFAALPSKINSIVDFQWGTNNSPEGLDDGFTHCFLLTFKDEAGRAKYLPHKAHKAFGNVLRPHMEKVFVLDYWGTQQDLQLDKPLKHAVFFKFKDDASPEDVKAVEDAFAALPSKIDTIKGFEWGTNNSPEKHADGFTHCFMVTFESDEGRAAYLPHDDHKAFAAALGPVLDKVRVLDFFVQSEKRSQKSDIRGRSSKMDRITSQLLSALKLDQQGDWDQAHEIVQQMEDPRAYWVHAYLHRKEGDLANASYWYNRASQPVGSGPLDEEWRTLHDTIEKSAE